MRQLLATLFFLSGVFAHANCGDKMRSTPKETIKINTSNAGKRAEFQRLFGDYPLSFTAHDLKEIDADPLTVVTHKASQFGPDENVLIEDTSLSVEGADIGVNVRWLLDNLNSLSGRPAVWTVYLARRVGEEVRIYKGEVHGHITQASGKGFGFDQVFLPNGEIKTLGEEKPDRVNARAKAVANFLRGQVFQTRPAILTWLGKWQHD